MNRPERTCVGCRGRGAKSDLLRLVRQPTSVTVDFAQREPGRGAYLHPDPQCLALAMRRRAVGRALKTTVSNPAQLEAAVRLSLRQGRETVEGPTA